MEIRVFVEGGGDQKAGLSRMRDGFDRFLSSVKSAAGGKRVGVRVVACGGRRHTYDKYAATRRRNPDVACILLVDAEGPVSQSPKNHLSQRDGWDLKGHADLDIHLMVQAMEAWFMADVEAVHAYFGDGFNRNPLPSRTNVEDIARDDLESSLDRAARGTAKKGYLKVRDGAGILGKLDCQKVRDRARHCDRFFRTLEELIGAQQPAH